MLVCRAFDDLESIDDTHGFNILLDDGNITEMNLRELKIQ